MRMVREVAQKTDLNHDGVIDYRDVALFEQMHGLPSTLSTQLQIAELIRRP